MNLAHEVSLKRLPEGIQSDIRLYCRHTNTRIGDIWAQPPLTRWQVTKIYGLICHLGKRGYSLKDIAHAVRQSKDICKKALKYNNKRDYSIKTQDWGA